MPESDTPQPYELLIRWGDDGTIAGAHVQRIAISTDPFGRPVAAISDPQPLAEAAAQGYPVAEAIAFLQAALPPAPPG